MSFLIPKKKASIVFFVAIGIGVALLMCQAWSMVGINICCPNACPVNNDPQAPPDCELNCLTIWCYNEESEGVAGVNLEIQFSNGTLLASGTTDANGFFTTYVEAFGCAGSGGSIDWEYTVEQVGGTPTTYTGTVGYGSVSDGCDLYGGTGCCYVQISVPTG